MSAGTQKDSFHTILSDTLGESCNYEIVKSIHENLNEMIEENKESLDSFALDKKDMRRLLSVSGVAEENLESFDKDYDEAVGEKSTLLVSNIASTRKFNIKTPEIVINVNPERARPGRNQRNRR